MRFLGDAMSGADSFFFSRPY